VTSSECPPPFRSRQREKGRTRRNDYWLEEKSVATKTPAQKKSGGGTTLPRNEEKGKKGGRKILSHNTVGGRFRFHLRGIQKGVVGKKRKRYWGKTSQRSARGLGKEKRPRRMKGGKRKRALSFTMIGKGDDSTSTGGSTGKNDGVLSGGEGGWSILSTQKRKCMRRGKPGKK